jgi:hypothetical protein
VVLDTNRWMSRDVLAEEEGLAPVGVYIEKPNDLKRPLSRFIRNDISQVMRE